MKRNVNPLVAVVTIVTAVAVAAVVWVHGLTPERSHGRRPVGIGITVKPRDLNKARENAQKAKDKFQDEAKRGAHEQAE